MDVVALQQAIHALKRYTPVKPAGIGWDDTHFPLGALGLQESFIGGRQLASIGLTPRAAFDGVTTARTAPGATFYVNVGTATTLGGISFGTGADANNGTAPATPFKSLFKAIQAANAAAVPSLIYVAAGTYFRANNLWASGGSGTAIGTDVCLVAVGGRVVTGTFDSPGSPSRDATQTNTYSWSVASVNRVCDMTNLNRFGNYNELTNVSTAALCNVIPDSWALVAGTLYVNRRDQVAPSSTNTRVFRPATANVQVVGNVNILFTGNSGNDGWDLEGASTTGVVDVLVAIPGATNKVFAAENCTFKYGGGVTDTGARGISIDSWQGLVYLSNCRSDANQTDGFNFHNSHSATNVNILTVNCTAYDNGRLGQQSCNGWTSHETVVGVDLGGHYKSNRGGTLRSINTTKTWFAGFVIEDDLGDIGLNGGGTMTPTAIRTDDTAEYYLDRGRIIMPAGTVAYSTGASGAKIHRRSCWPVAQPDTGPGTFDTY